LLAMSGADPLCCLALGQGKIPDSLLHHQARSLLGHAQTKRVSPVHLRLEELPGKAFTSLLLDYWRRTFTC